MPQTIVIPTQAQLLQQQQYNATHSPLAVFNAYQQAKRGGGIGAPTTPISAAPGANPNSQNLLTPVGQQPAPWTLPGYDPSVFKITAPEMPAWQNVTAPAVPQNNMDWVRATTEMINQINQQAQVNANAARIPGATGLEGQSSANIHNALAGQLPQDVINQIGTAAAERGVSAGSPWGANANADYLKAIGLNSLQLQNTGQDWLTSALGRNPSAPIFDPGRLVITPAQQAQFALEGANINLANQRGSFEASNANAARQLQASLANASNQQERDRLMLQYQQDQTARENANAQRQLQYDLENARTQFERDKLLTDYQQRQLDRENALRMAGYRNQAGYGGAGHAGSGAFNPATNWYTGGGGSGLTGLNTPAAGWHLPYSLGNNNQLPDEFLDQFYGGTNPVTPTVTPTPTGDFGDWNNLLPPMNPPYQGPGDLSDEDYFNLYGG